MTRCPSCGAGNLVDSSNVTVYQVDQAPRPSSPLSSSPGRGAGDFGSEPQRARTARRIAELVDANQIHYGSLTDEQKAQVTDWHYLDAVIAGGGPSPDWLRNAVELRSIGHQLNRDGGVRLMREAATQADGLSRFHVVLGVIDLFWDRIGDWQG
jgi:hypothetical protein